MGKIKIHQQRSHQKASERYVDVTFFYEDNFIWEVSIPIEYRRTGIDLSDILEINDYIQKVYEDCHPNKWQKWREDQHNFWQDKQKKETWQLFEILQKTFHWTCVACEYNNPNWARRNQDLKEMGYTIATKINCHCNKCNNKKRTFLLLLPLPRGEISGYEHWSPSLRDKIVNLLDTYDAYEGRIVKKESLLPDHKFPEIRWDLKTQRHCLENLTDEDLKNDFQLLSNQRNLQKREVCRQCYQTNKRGYPFGIKYYYQGSENWLQNIPKKGKEAEKGCIGCGWYDLEKWRNSLNKQLNSD